MTTVSVLGLGKLGLPMAAVFAYKGAGFTFLPKKAIALMVRVAHA